MSFPVVALRISAGVVVWAMHFAAIYGFTALACARGTPRLVPWIVGTATLVAAVACIAILLRELRRREAFESWLAAGLAGFALVAVLWEAVPVLVMAPCG